MEWGCSVHLQLIVRESILLLCLLSLVLRPQQLLLRLLKHIKLHTLLLLLLMLLLLLVMPPTLRLLPNLLLLKLKRLQLKLLVYGEPE
jgi:hypothetical protein